MFLNYYKSTGRFLILFTLLNLTTTLIFSYVLFNNQHVDDSNSMTSITTLPWPLFFFVVVVFAPVVETYILQYLIIEKVIKMLNNKVIAILISAIIFGLLHTYSVPYVLKCTITGLSYGIAYVTFKNKNNNPIMNVAIIHAAHNFVGFLIDAFA